MSRSSAPARWLVYACRTDYAVDVVEILGRCGAEAVLVDNLAGPESAPSSATSPAQLHAGDKELPAVIPLLTPGHRHAVAAEARRLGITSFPALLDPSAVVAASATTGPGTVVNAGVVLAGAVRAGTFVHVNRSASVGHHSELEDFTTLGPGCVLAGRVRVGRGAFVGAGAVCAPTVCIGPNAIVGAGAVVVKDVPAGAVVVGNPARVIRRDDVGYGGVAVPS